VTGVDTVTGLVLTAKVTLVEPAGTVTLAGGVAASLLLDNVTVAPSAGAGKVSVTVPVGAEVPPMTLAGVRLSEEKVAGVSLIRIAKASGNGLVVAIVITARSGLPSPLKSPTIPDLGS